MIAVTIATTVVWIAGVCALMSLHRSTGPTGPAALATGPAAPTASLPGPRVSPEDEAVMPTLPVAPFVPAPRSPLR